MPDAAYDYNHARYAEDVNLAAADPGCQRCQGTGYTGATVEPDAEMRTAGVTDPIPVVCRCVTRNNGVKPGTSPNERARSQMERGIRDDVASGAWARKHAGDVLRNVPPWRQIIVAARLEEQATTVEDTDAATATAFREAARLIREGIDAALQ